MPLTLTWQDIALRLGLTILAGALIGLDRTGRGQAAGLRTTLLVCLAASIAMIQTNVLMATTGRAANSLVMMDVMRLPLGILTGMGFIGAGAILRRGETIQGVTTAATLWTVTVIGLCLGGGQLVLGMSALIVTLVVLWAVKPLENLLLQQRHGALSISLNANGPSDKEIRAMLSQAGFRIKSWEIYTSRAVASPPRKIRCEVRWRGHIDDFLPPPIINDLAQHPGVTSLRWTTP